MSTGTFLISTFGTNGDVLPFIRLGRVLRERGHEVVLHTHEYYGATARDAGLTFVPVDTEEAYTETLRDARDLLLNVLADINNLADYYRRNGLWEQIRIEYEAMAELVRDRDPSRVVAVSRHTSGLSVLMLREAFGIPAAWVSPAPTMLMAVPLTERIFPGTLAGSMNEIRAKVDLPPIEDWSPWLSSADLTIGLWPAWFDEAGERAPGTTDLPGFILHDEAESGALPEEIAALVADDVPAQRRPVLVTGGSGQLLHKEWYRVAVEACVRNDRPAIVACRHRDLLPDVLPDGVHWQPTLPFKDLMPRVAAVVHHGGILTCARSVLSGTPQVILAHGTDRPDNAARMHRLRLAEWLPAARWTSEATAALLASVLTDPGYAARSRAYAARIESSAAASTAADRIERLLGTTPTALPTAAVPVRQAAPSAARTRVEQLDPEQRRALTALLRNRRAAQER
jgi:rhamnosyltransferase subunit B